jgi:hypothetical protein
MALSLEQPQHTHKRFKLLDKLVPSSGRNNAQQWAQHALNWHDLSGQTVPTNLARGPVTCMSWNAPVTFELIFEQILKPFKSVPAIVRVGAALREIELA